FDGAHTPESLQEILQTLPPQPTCVLFGTLQDKRISQMLRLFHSYPHLQLYLTTAPSPRGAPSHQLAKVANSLQLPFQEIPNPNNACKKLMEKCRKHQLPLLITGSIRMRKTIDNVWKTLPRRK
ncbi:MAG: hypothetical protein D6805_04000, partial [Planctomycetota bacterium]